MNGHNMLCVYIYEWAQYVMPAILVRSIHVLQCVAVCCSVLQCVAVCCCVLQCVTVCCSVKHATCHLHMDVLQCVAACCSVLQCVAVCCSVRCRGHITSTSLAYVHIYKKFILHTTEVACNKYVAHVHELCTT